MHNIKDIRKDFTAFAKSLAKRTINVDFANLQ
jgi:seryl-tRNA synthetase